MTVMEFVLAARFAYGGAFGWESDDDVAAARSAIEHCELSEFSDRLMNELSGGERQRVLLARALATGATILLLDEPTTNLDLAHQASMFELIRTRCDELDHSAFIVTHDLNLASEFADTVLLLKGGRIVAAGEPKSVLTNKNLEEVFGINVLLDENPVTQNVRVTAVFRSHHGKPRAIIENQ
jgi:iron complex transport system ATP-binding protein